MLKQLFKNLQKIPISIKIKHFFLLFYSINLHVIYFLKTYFKAYKILFKFCIMNIKNFFDGPWIVRVKRGTKWCKFQKEIILLN